MKRSIIIVTVLAFLASVSLATKQQKESELLNQREQALKDDVPRILCLDKNFATGGQPSDQAFSKLAAQGFRSVLSLRTPTEGIDMKKEQGLAEQAGMRYFNIPVVSKAPQPEQVKEFIKVVKDKSNHPMLVYCGSANRVGAFWMIYRVVEQGWTEDKALEEATKIGLKGPELKEFAHNYIVQHKVK